jgi:hypothetical protein
MSVYIFNSTIEDGIMSDYDTFYKDLSQEEIDCIYDSNKRKFIEKHNLNYSNLVLINQKDDARHKGGLYDYPDGKCIKLHDIPDEKQYSDMLMIDKDSNIILGERAGDCPIMIAYTDNLLVMGHIGARYIDRLLPKDIIQALLNEKEDPKDIIVYISPYIHNYIYDIYPPWANSYVWKDAIINKDNKYYIDLSKAIEIQLLEMGILKENIEFSEIDTYTNPNYFSHRAYNQGNKCKLGRHMVFATFKNE